jgi:leader peptidase (prepilin peptidase)/N-methyltransferase
MAATTLANLTALPAWAEGLPLPLPLALALWLGACFGSFSNVLIYRLPRDLSVVGPRSFCPACEKQLSWFDNVPLLSWVFLRGRCRRCGTAISVRYFLVEVAGALCVLAGLAVHGWTMAGVSSALFLLLLLDIAIIDWQHMIIPHTLTVAGMVLGLLFALTGQGDLLRSVLGLLVGGGIILAVSYGYKILRGMVGMGGGDVMLMGMVGSFLGPWGAVAVLFGGALLGTLFAVTAGKGQVSGAAKLPFGTFLALAAAVIMFFGENIFRWYLGQF